MHDCLYNNVMILHSFMMLFHFFPGKTKTPFHRAGKNRHLSMHDPRACSARPALPATKMSCFCKCLPLMWRGKPSFSPYTRN